MQSVFRAAIALILAGAGLAIAACGTVPMTTPDPPPPVTASP